MSQHQGFFLTVMTSPLNSATRRRRRPEPQYNVEPLYRRHILSGQQPPLNGWSTSIADEASNTVYFYGGVRACDEASTPTNELYLLDLKKDRWEWQNLTKDLQNIPMDLYAPGDIPFPALFEPAWASLSLERNGPTFLIFFGGQPRGANAACADLICVDVQRLRWWKVLINGPLPRGRTGAAMVAHDKRLFIFGGRSSREDNAEVLDSFSIATFDSQRRQWSWTVADEPMPLSPGTSLGYQLGATLVYGGKKVLLMQGHLTEQDPIDLSPATTLFFHTDHHTFGDATLTHGPFARGLYWYRLAYIESRSEFAHEEEPPAVDGPRSKRRRVDPGRAPADAAPFPASVIIAGWVKPEEGGQNITPEVWQYAIPPSETIRCLDIKDKIYNLELNLQDFFVVGGRMLLFGSTSGEDEGDGGDACWDIAIEIPFSELDT
ncbi:hypothetical protein HMN09_00775800 [Mycena chlorophos]|uniref:Galactose oxidase n=1 Tax=Mycena chlorophos TaxID=658473 RepID=A0A8H6SUB8_MYCCL|nr:hypothetical protein HMN09_00775800 [Mycena chlorophos]